MKKLTCLILSIILIIGCISCSKEERDKSKTNGEATTKAAVKYNINELQKPDGMEIVDFICYSADGTLKIGGTDLNGEGKSIWDSQDDGKSWKSIAASGSVPEFMQTAYYYKYSADGAAYVCNENIIMGGASTELNIELPSQAVYIDSAMAAENLFVLIQDQNSEKQIWQYNLNTSEGAAIENETLSEYLGKSTGGGCLASDRTGKKLYFEGNGIVEYDVDSGKTKTLIEESLLGQLLDFKNEPVIGLAVNGKQEIVIRSRNMQSGSDNLYYLSKGEADSSKNNKKSEDKTLEVYSLKENSMVRSSLAFFRRNHIDVPINYTVGYTGEDGVTLSDAVRNLNTAIMAGEGPDILVLDNLPVEQYIEKDVLEDLSDVVQQERDNLLYNIIESCNTDDGIHAVPTAVSIPVIIGSEPVTSAGNTMDMLNQMKKESVGNAVIPAKDFPVAAVNLFVTSDIVGDEIEESRLIEFYQEMAELKSLCGLESDSTGEYSLQAKANMFPYNYYPVGLDIYLGKAQAGIETLSGGDSYIEVNSTAKQTNLTMGYLNKKDSNYFIPLGMLGVNSMGTQKEVAKEFVKMYLSEEVQNTNTVGFSVNRASMKRGIQVTDSPQYYSTLFEEIEDTSGLDLYTLSSQEYESFVSFVEKLDTPVKSDAMVLDTIMEQADNVLFQGLDTQEAAKAACDKINIYLKE